MKLIDKIFNAYIPTLFINFKCLPFRQAVKLPIYVYRTRFINLSGRFVFAEDTEFTRGMIKIGHPETSLFSKRRYNLDVRGEVLFHGPCHLGFGGSLSVGSKGLLELGSQVIVSDCSKIICFHYIILGNKTTAGWECSFCDTDFHAMKNAFTEKKMKAYAPVKIGECCWLGGGVTVLKGTTLPNHTTVSACSVLNKKYKCEEKSIIAGNPAEIASEGCFYRDMDDDRFEYTEYVR